MKERKNRRNKRSSSRLKMKLNGCRSLKLRSRVLWSKKSKQRPPRSNVLTKWSVSKCNQNCTGKETLAGKKKNSTTYI